MNGKDMISWGDSVSRHTDVMSPNARRYYNEQYLANFNRHVREGESIAKKLLMNVRTIDDQMNKRHLTVGIKVAKIIGGCRDGGKIKLTSDVLSHFIEREEVAFCVSDFPKHYQESFDHRFNSVDIKTSRYRLVECFSEMFGRKICCYFLVETSIDWLYSNAIVQNRLSLS